MLIPVDGRLSTHCSHTRCFQAVVETYVSSRSDRGNVAERLTMPRTSRTIERFRVSTR
jgi:hypothetical protein